VLHGNRTYLLMDDDGQILEATRSRPASTIPASGRSIPGCAMSGRVTYLSATDKEALAAFQLCCKLEGIIPRSSRRMRWRKWSMKLAPRTKLRGTTCW
jgi:tryptophan synthase beta chain